MNPLSNPIYLMPPLIAAVTSFALLSLVLLKSHKSFKRLMLCSILVSVGLWSLLTFGMRSSPDLQHAFIWEKAIIVVGSAVFLFYYHFSLSYTNTTVKTGVIIATYLLLAIIAALAFTDVLVEGMRLEYYGYAPITRPISYPLFAAGPLFIVGGIYNFIKRYKVSLSYEERNRLIYLSIAGLFPVSGALLDGFTNLPPAAIWGNLIFCIICTVAILKYHLLDIRVVVRKSLVYLLISAGIAVPYVSLLYLLHYILEPKLGPWWIHVLIILLLAIILRPLYSSAQQLADRLFYRDRYDNLRALQRFSRQAQSIVNLEELVSSMVKLVGGALRTSSVCLLLPSEEKRGLVMASSTGLEEPLSGVVLRDSSPLVKWLELHGDIISSEQLNIVPQLQSFSLKEKNNLERMGAKLYVPIKTHQGQLSGILVLGQKLSEQSYSGEDKQLLTALTNQMGMALENARLYEETRESERVLRESKELFEKIFTSHRDAIFILDTKNPPTIVDCNPRAIEIFGYTRQEMLGRTTAFLHVSETALHKFQEHLYPTIEKCGFLHLPEFEMKQKDGTAFPTEHSVVPLKDQQGNRIGWVSVVRDITEYKRAEEREKKLQQELYLSSRLASIGQLAAGVAHEINNPLTGVMGFSQRLLRKSTDEEFSRGLEIIHSEAQRAAKVVQNLLTFARYREPTKEYSDINDILQKALELRAYELKTSNIEIVTDLDPGLPMTIADFHQIEEVFLNIIVNAEQAMTETNREGKLTIKTQVITGNIRVSFTDDGPRIPAEHLDKLFDPFFTTRGEVGGTGLGLSICHGIVVEHGGRIYARSKPGKGTTFIVELPVITEEADKTKIVEE